MPENALRNGLRFIPKFTEPRTTPFHPTKPPTENPEGKSNKMRNAINLLRKPLGVMLGAAALMLNAESLPKELQLRQDGTLAIEPYQYHDRDVLFTCSADTLFKIAQGKTDPVPAVMMGKLKVEGNIDKALKLKELLKSRR